MGMVRNYNDSVQISRHNMSTRSMQLYDDFNREAYDFTNCRKPDIVLINLGTNDYSTLVKPTPEQYVGAYLKMIDNIRRDRKSTRLNSSHANISYAVFCLKKKKQHDNQLYAI